MLLMGDENRRTQRGNNNAYCQDNELSWVDWSKVEKHSDLLHFVKALIQFTQSLQIFEQERVLSVTYGSHEPHLVWHGVQLGQPDWSNNSHSLAFSLRHPERGEHLHIILNAYWEPLQFELPLLGSQERWYRIVDTALPSPDDFCEPKVASVVESDAYRAEGRSTVVLMAIQK
jgi:glycogen operon protein